MKVTVNLPNMSKGEEGSEPAEVEVIHPFVLLDSEGNETQYRTFIALGMFVNGVETEIPDDKVTAYKAVPVDVVVGDPLPAATGTPSSTSSTSTDPTPKQKADALLAEAQAAEAAAAANPDASSKETN
jgi:hypothetical protein